MRTLFLTIAILAIAWSCTAWADTPALAGTELYGELLAREKPVTLETLRGHNALLAFWRTDCAPCRAEMAKMPRIARENPDFPIVVIALQDAKEVRTFFTEPLPPNIHIIIPQDDAITVLHNFGDTSQALPFSTTLHSDGSICDQHYGILGPEKIDWWARKC